MPGRAGHLAADVGDKLLQRLVLLTRRLDEAYVANIDMKSLYDQRAKDGPFIIIIIPTSTADSGQW